MLAKITVAGEKIYKNMSETCLDSRLKLTYQTDAPRDGGRERVEDVHGWRQPFCQSLIAAARFVEFLNLNMEDSKYGGS